MRARLALAISAQDCLLREIVLRDKPEEMLAISPKGTVPVLQLKDGSIIEQSLDIMDWALRQNDPAQWRAQDREIITFLIERNDGAFKHHLDRYKYPNRYEEEAVMDHRAQAAVILQDLETRLKQHAYLVSDAPCLADYAIFPFIRQFAHTDKAWFDAAPYPHLQKWLVGLLESELFLSIMVKVKPWNETGKITGEDIFLLNKEAKTNRIRACRGDILFR